MSDAKIVVTAVDSTAAAFASIEKSLGKLTLSAESVKGAFEAVGVTLSAGYFVELIKDAIEAGDHLNNLSKTTNISVETLAGLKLLAQQTGTDIDSLAKGVGKLQVELGKTPDKFRELGITAKDGTGALKQFSDIFNLLPDINQRNALAQAVFKKSWEEMAPLLTLGSQKIQEAIDKGEALSNMTKAQALASEEFNNKLAELSGTHGLLNQQIQTMLPLMTEVVDTFLDLKGKGEDLDKDAFHPLAETFRAIAILGGNVAFVFRGIGIEIGGLAAQAGALGIGLKDVLGGPTGVAAALATAAVTGEASASRFHEISAQMKKDADDNRAAFDKWEQKMLSTATSLQVVGDTSDALSRRLGVAARSEQQAAAARAQAFLDSKNGATASEAAYDSLIKKLNERLAADKKELEVGRPLTDQEKLRVKTEIDLADIMKKYPGASKERVKALLDEIDAEELKKQVQASQLDLEKQIAAQRQAEKNTDYSQSAAGINAITDAWTAQLKAVNDSVKAQQAEADAERLVIGLNITHAQAVEMVTISRLRDAQTRTVVDGEAYKALQQQIDAHLQLLGLLNDKTAWDQQIAQMQRVQDLGKTLWDDLWSGGHNTFQKLGADIKKFLIDELYQLVVKQWVFNIAANVVGGGASGLAGGVTSGIGSGIGGSLIGGSLLTVGKQFFTGGMSGANAAGTLYANATGSGIDGLLMTNGAYGTAAGGASAGGAAAGVLGAIPVAGWIALGAMVDMAMNKKAGISPAYSLIAPGIGVGLMGLEKLGIVQAPGGPKDSSAFGSIARDGVDSSAAGTIAQAIQAQYTAIAGALGVTNTTLANLGVFYSQDTKGTAQTQLQIAGGSYTRSDQYGGNFENVTRGAQGLQDAETLASAQLDLKNLQDATTGQIGDFLKSVNVATASLGDMQKALQVATDVYSFDTAIKALGSTFSTMTGLSVDNKEALIQQFGSVQNLSSALANFNDKFLTSQEKLTLQQQQLNAAFQQAGVVLPASIDAYKAAVQDAQSHLDTDAGRNTFATLINNAQAFYDASQLAANGVSALSSTMISLQGDSAKLQVQLLKLQGNTDAANAGQFAIDTAGMSPDEIAQYKANQALQASIDTLTASQQTAAAVDKERAGLQDQLNQLTMSSAQLLQLQRDSLDASNQTLFDQINAVKTQQAVDAAAQQKAAAIAQQKATLQDQLNQLTMTSAQLLQLQRDSLDASNQALFDQINAIQTQQAADAAAAAHDMAVANERYGLETQLLNLQGDTADLRARELAALQPENRALMEQIYALEDAKTAEQKRTQAMQAATAAANQQKTAWHQLATTIGQEADRIHAEMVGPTSLAAASANLAILEARARAGDQGAASQIVAASQQVDALAASSAHSATELALSRASLAYGLSQTSSIIDRAYGTSSNAPVVDQLRTLNGQVAKLQKTMELVVNHVGTTAVHSTALRNNSDFARIKGTYITQRPGAVPITTKAA